MKSLKITTDPRVEAKFNSYPKHIQTKMNILRQLVLQTAKEIESIKALEETLKWGEPSFITNQGSTLRMDWKTKNANQYAMYFKCTSKLVPTFKEIFADTFQYEKNRAILFELDSKIPKKELKECIRMTLLYHSLKGKDLLGYSKA